MQLSSSQAQRLIVVALLLSTFSIQLSAQRPPAQPHAAEILHRMQKLNVLGSVLYIVAHPDDENTRLIAWLANGKKVRTGNLSLTRGDGGQNLIGPELGDALGIIRTQELMEARRIDGGEQFFTRAVDFGYSKNAAESFAKWGKQEVLRDVVHVIRMFQPDVIITRFAPDRSAGHGHHEASAILAEEAFDLAGDPKAFPEQLEQGLEVWQPRRLFFNGSTWWKKDLADIAKSDPDWFTVDVGGYDPLLGLSYTEIAGRSRSMHKSQGFGAAETRGEQMEYLKLVKGDRPKGKDIFEGIDMTWNRVERADIQSSITELIDTYDPTDPSASIERLLALTELISTRTYNVYKQSIWNKKWNIQELTKSCLGFTLEFLLDGPYDVDPKKAGELVVHNRSPLPILLREWLPDTIPPFGSRREKKSWESSGTGSRAVSPYWLDKPHTNLYVSDPIMTGQPINGEFGVTDIHVGREATILTVNFTGIYKWVDRIDGERIRPVYLTPVASVIPKSDVLIARGGPQMISVDVEALTDSLRGELSVSAPPGWLIAANSSGSVNMGVTINKRNERNSFTVSVEPTAQAQPGNLKFAFTGPKGTADRTLHEIDYPHIMPQVYYTPAEVKLVPLDVTTTAKRVGYVKGAGDEVPQALEQLGVVVEFIEPTTSKLEELKKYDAIVTGIRAYNATKGMKELHPLLLQYVKEGGTLIVQYNTTPRFAVSGVEDFQIDPSTLGPHPFKITRDRVTVEEAPPTFLDPKHPLLTTPNEITAADFDGWVQERGLYFAGDLGDKYTPLIAWNDPGEQPLTGGLITCDHGKGRFIYTGISFFRQLPAGVPGAYRLFANLISPRVAK
jgi:LmbE family N-acetylglucosaminyl deacetylase